MLVNKRRISLLFFKLVDIHPKINPKGTITNKAGKIVNNDSAIILLTLIPLFINEPNVGNITIIKKNKT